MRNFWERDLRDYLRCLWRYWWLVGFTIFVAGGGAAQDMFDIDLPGWVWWAIVVGGLVIAQFLTWRDMKKERDELKRLDVRQESIEKLTGFRDDLVSIQNEEISDTTALGRLAERYDNKRMEIIDYLKSNFSVAESNLFERKGVYNTVILQSKNYVDVDHMNLVAQVIRDHMWLEKCAQDYSRQRYRPELITEPEAEDGAR